MWKPFRSPFYNDTGKYLLNAFCFCSRLDSPTGPRPHGWGFESTLRHTTLGRTPLDDRPDRRRDLYMITHKTHDRHPCHRRDSNQQPQQQKQVKPLSGMVNILVTPLINSLLYIITVCDTLMTVVNATGTCRWVAICSKYIWFVFDRASSMQVK